MKRAPSTLLAVALTVSASAALAGDYRCDTEASLCVREMVDHIAKKGWIGIEFENLADAVITRVVAGSPAEKAGVKLGDLWLGLDDLRFAGQGEKEAMYRLKKLLVPGKEATFHLRREGRELELPLEVGKVPEHILAQWVGQHVMEHHMAPADEEVLADQGGKSAKDGD